METKKTDDAHDPFAGCLPTPSGETNAVTKMALPLVSPPRSSPSADDIDVVVERVVSRIVKEMVTPVIERVRLSAEKRLDRLQASLETIEGTLNEFVEAHMGREEDQSGQGDVVDAMEHREPPEQPELPERLEGLESKDRGDENGPSVASSSTIEDVEALRAGLQALMRENEARMKLLDKQLQATTMPPPPPPPPPPPSTLPVRQYVPPPQPFQHVSPPQAAVRTQTAVAPPPPQQAGVPVELVIDDIAVMGFSREEVRSVLRELTAQGKPVDMNIVLDRLSG